MVFGSHLVERFPAPPLTGFTFLTAMADEAVTYFFVLSGFVLIIGSGAASGTVGWWRKRLARVGPVYLVTGVASLAFVTLQGQQTPLLAIVAFFTATQAWWASTTFAINPPAWTVSCEVFFYAVFPVTALLIARLRNPAVIWCGIGLLLGAHLWFGPTVGTQYPPARLLDFVLGLLLGAAFAGDPRRHVGLGAAALLFVVAQTTEAISGVDAAYGGIRTIALATSGLLILELAAWDRAGRPGPPAGLVTLGLWSYAFYLVHYLVLRMLAAGLGHLSSATTYSPPQAVVIALVALCGSLGAARLLYRRIEQPAEHRLRGAAPRVELLGARAPR